MLTLYIYSFALFFLYLT